MDLGKKGEEMVERLLMARGFTRLVRNYRFDHGELDIVMSKQNHLYFIEVKTRSGVSFGYPEEAVGLKKRKSMHKVAEAFISQCAYYSFSPRFLIAAVIVIAKTASVRFFEMEE